MSLIRRLPWRRFVRRQQSYIAIAVAIYAALWAVDRPADISSTLIYTLPLCNLIAVVKDYLGAAGDRSAAWFGNVRCDPFFRFIVDERTKMILSKRNFLGEAL
jgi:hypothetical protein